MKNQLLHHVRRLVVGALLLSAAAGSFAQLATRSCSGTVANTYVDWDGGVLFIPSFRGDYVRVCSLRATSAGNGVSIDPVTCAGWFALIRQAASSNRSVTLRYDDAPACNALPNYYSAPFPVYVMLN
jgi:hypothetical protein